MLFRYNSGYSLPLPFLSFVKYLCKRFRQIFLYLHIRLSVSLIPFYSLLLTFVAFFIFIGNLGRIPAFSGWLQEFLTGREVLVAVLASQVTSNVPAALLLSGFTAETQALIIGTNLGGLGTLIASMASLISYRQIARELPQGKKQYFGLFTLTNLIFLAILLGVWFLLR